MYCFWKSASGKPGKKLVHCKGEDELRACKVITGGFAVNEEEMLLYSICNTRSPQRAELSQGTAPREFKTNPRLKTFRYRRERTQGTPAVAWTPLFGSSGKLVGVLCLRARLWFPDCFAFPPIPSAGGRGFWGQSSTLILQPRPSTRFRTPLGDE